MAARINSKIKSKRDIKSLHDSHVNKHVDDNDTSVLSKPFTTSISGLANALKVFNTGTEEVRDYLTYECEILYECRICRNIFRSLSNFILHKRTYCQEKYNCVIHLKCANNRKDEYMNIIEKQVYEKKNDEENKRPEKKSLNSLVESLAQKKQFGFERKDFSISDFYKSSTPGILCDSYDKFETQMNLEHINGSSSGVFQTICKNQDNCENKLEEIQLEVAEIQSMLEGQSVVLGPDGKILDLNKGNITHSGLSFDDSNSVKSDRTCGQCKIKFATRKTYASHMKYKHADSRLVYPCPECSEVYASSWSVYRHLFNIHRKSLAQVRKLREHIQAKAFYQMQSFIKKSPQSSKTNINEQERIDVENQEWMDNFETDNDIQMCGGCGKRFERRAALNSHSQTCQKRIAARNAIIINRSKRIAAAEEKIADRKPAKLPRLEPITEFKEVDKRKPNILRKQKIGIQIRCDYTKSDKSVNDEKEKTPLRNNNLDSSKQFLFDVRNISKVDENTDYVSDADISDTILTSELISNTELYSIIGVPSDKNKINDQHKSSNENYNTLTDPEILSIHSSNNTTPNKDEDQLESTNMHDDTDSEIEEIFGCTSENLNNEFFRVSDISTSNRNKDEISNRKIDKDVNIVNENTLKLIKLIDSDSPQKNKISIDEKMENYIDIKKLLCKACNLRFSNLSRLRSHMSLHFNWMRFCCDVCTLKAYEKNIIYEHIKEVHNVLESDKIEAVIFQIPEWETIEMSSKELIELKIEDNIPKLNNSLPSSQTEIDNQENKSLTPDSCIFVQTEIYQPKTPKSRGRPPKRKCLRSQKNKKPDDTNVEDVKLREENLRLVDREVNEMKNMKDVALRKMVFEVIFGQNNEPGSDSDNLLNKADYTITKEKNVCIETTEVSNVISRPVRNRVKPVDKDFIYDLNEFTDIPRSVSQNSTRILGQQEKHITGSLEDLSVGKNKNIKKPPKRPGPKCKTMCPIDVSESDNRIVNLPLQNNGKDMSNYEEYMKFHKENDKNISTLESTNSNTIVNMFTYSDSSKNDVWIIEDD